MFLSIIIPCYNAEKYIGECLESCINQSFDPSNYEIICVNDGSIDKSKSIIQEWQTKSGLIKLINQENGGVSAARNTGIETAAGDYIWFVDADDFIQNGAVEKLYICCNKHQPDRKRIDAVSFRHYEFENCLNKTELHLKNTFEIRPNNSPAGHCIWESVYSREFILDHHLRFRTGISYREDGMFLFEFNYCSPNRYAIDDVLYFYRRNNTSATRTLSPAANQKRQESALQIAKVMTEYAVREKNKVAHANYNEQASKLMPMVRTITISAAELCKKDRKEILSALKAENLFPLFMYRRIKDWFPKAVHMNHSYMGFKGKVLDILNFYSTTTIGFSALSLINRLRRKTGNS